MANPVTITEDSFGVTADGKPVRRFTLKNNCGFSVQIINYGATITSLNVPLKNGSTVDVTLGFDNIQGYQLKENPYFGATVGRTANRTKPTKFKLGGKDVSLTQNEDDDHLHGGIKGFDKAMWDATIQGNSLVMKYTSLDGEEGYPGNLLVTTCFSISADNSLCIVFSAKTDQTTIVNMTNHAYFNLAGHNAGADELLKHELKIEADCYTKLVDKIATGELVPVSGTGYDFRTPQLIGEAMKKISEDGFDINYCLKPPTEGLKFAAMVSYKPNGLSMEVFTTAPGVQLYTSNGFVKISGKGKSCYKKYAALCLETQHFPNSANIKSFPSIELNPGQEYKHQVIYKFKC